MKGNLSKLKQPELGRTLKEKREALNLLQTAVADLAAKIYYEKKLAPAGGYDPNGKDRDHETVTTNIAQAITQFEKAIKGKYNSSKYLDYIQESLFQLGNLTSPTEVAANEFDNPATAMSSFRHFLVHPTVVAGAAGEIFMGVEKLKFVEAPHNLIDVPGAFGFVISGTSMEPKYSPKDVLWVDPRKPPRPGRFVLVCPLDPVSNRTRFVRLLVRDGTTKWTLKQFSPELEHDLDKAEWPTCQVVVGSTDREDN